MKFIKKWLEKLHIIHNWSDYINTIVVPEYGFLCVPAEKEKTENSPLRLFRFEGNNRPVVIRSRMCLNPKCLKMQADRISINMISVSTSNENTKQNIPTNYVQVSKELQ
jgi:hypothetical protein